MGDGTPAGGGTGGGPDPSTQPDPAPPRTVLPDPVPEQEMAALVGRPPLSPGSVEDLNRQLAKDPVLGLRVVRTLVDDPAAWDRLFALDDARRASLGGVAERSRSAPMSRLVEKVAVLADDLARVTIVVTSPDTGMPLEEAEEKNPWWVPDQLDLKLKTDTTGVSSAELDVQWKF
jgi:hypothetical protein